LSFYYYYYYYYYYYGQSSRRLDNSRTSQLADSEFLKIMELLYFVCTLNITLTLILTLSNIGSV